jgi:rSAM/selenodomain-associated transferase 2
MVSVIIPALNEARRLAPLLASLQALTPEPEVVVVDGGSADATVDVVRRFPQVKLIVAPRGRARQMNAGARVATGDILLFLHADTALPTGALEEVVAALRRPAVVGGRFDVRFDSARPIFRLIAAMMNARSRVSGIATGDQAIFVRRPTFDTLGGYPDIPLMEDVEFSRRLKRQGRLACLALRVTTSARKWQQEGVARTILLMWALRFLYAAGVEPARLQRWYYGNPTQVPRSDRSPAA